MRHSRALTTVSTLCTYKNVGKPPCAIRHGLEGKQGLEAAWEELPLVLLVSLGEQVVSDEVISGVLDWNGRVSCGGRWLS